MPFAGLMMCLFPLILLGLAALPVAGIVLLLARPKR